MKYLIIIVVLLIFGTGYTFIPKDEHTHEIYEFKVWPFLWPVNGSDPNTILEDFLNEGWTIERVTAIQSGQLQVVYILKRLLDPKAARPSVTDKVMDTAISYIKKAQE